MFQKLTRGAGQCRSKRKNAARASERNRTTPHSRRNCKPSASPRRNDHPHLPPKKRPTLLIRRAPRVLSLAAARSEGTGPFGAAMTPAQLTPNPLPDEDDAETPQDEAPTPKKEDAAPAKTIRRAKRP